MTALFLPCPRCAGTGWDSHADRHAETIMDRCRECGGTGQVAAATGERREAEGASFIRRVPADAIDIAGAA